MRATAWLAAPTSALPCLLWPCLPWVHSCPERMLALCVCCAGPHGTLGQCVRMAQEHARRDCLIGLATCNQDKQGSCSCMHACMRGDWGWGG